jgi:glycosyl transferase family 87
MLPRPVATVLICLGLTFYVALGLRTEIKFTAIKPIPESLMQDFNIYKGALEAVEQGEDPYADRSIGSGFLYPPPALLFFLPFDAVDDEWQASLFTALNLSALAIILYGIAEIYKLPFSRMWWWFPLAFGFAPFLEVMHMGQVNILVSLGVLLMLAYMDRRPAVSGVALAAAICLKVTPLAYVLYLATICRFRVIAFAALAVAALVLVWGAAFSFQHFITYADVFRDLARASLPADGNGQSLPALLTFHGIIPSESIQETQRALNILVALSVLCSAFLVRQGSMSEGLFVVLGLALVSASNIVWYHHYAFLLLPLFVWIAATNLNPLAIAWVVGGLTIVNVDRWALTSGLLVHAFIGMTILLILATQVADVVKQRQRDENTDTEPLPSPRSAGA